MWHPKSRFIAFEVVVFLVFLVFLLAYHMDDSSFLKGHFLPCQSIQERLSTFDKTFIRAQRRGVAHRILVQDAARAQEALKDAVYYNCPVPRPYFERRIKEALAPLH